MKKSLKSLLKLGILLIFVFAIAANPLVACKEGDPLDPKKPVTIKLWHYYTSALEATFEKMVQEFNETVGKDRGVIVASETKSSVKGLNDAVLSSANNEVGAESLPNIFASYADHAYEIEKKGLLADIGDYLTKSEQAEYVDSFIEEGKIGQNGELRIFPIAKASEILMLNDTDWKEFAEDYDYTYEDLATYESIAKVSEDYYNWTDAKTPNKPNDGKAFFGRDSMANLFVISAKEFGDEIFEVNDGVCKLNINEATMKKIWDYYYVPFISGYYYSSGSFSSQDTKVGDILSYSGSTASANYAPNEVTIDGESHAITPKMLPVPHFEGGEKVQIQQGAGMVVTKSNKQKEYASVLFLKWFTDITTNTVFSAASAYMPVKKAASNFQSMKNIAEQNDIAIPQLMDETLNLTFDAMSNGTTLYTNKAFDGGAAARIVLDTHLQNKATADRAAIKELIANGTSHAAAVAEFNTQAAFDTWLASFRTELESKIVNA